MGQQVQCLGGCMALRVRSQEWSHVSQLLVQLLGHLLLLLHLIQLLPNFFKFIEEFYF